MVNIFHNFTNKFCQKILGKSKFIIEIKTNPTPKKTTYWLENHELHNYFSTCMWNLDTDWQHYIKEKYSLNNQVCLSIGCGTGNLERSIIEIGCAKNVDAFDISATSILNAKKLADTNGLKTNYFEADANNIILKNNKYDFVVAHNSIHHIKNLEHIMQQISNSLKRDGLFIMVEFVGPTRFQWSDQQLKIINDILEMLPNKFKKISQNGQNYKTEFNHETLKGYLDSDPSEAVRSGDIISITNNFFEILEERNMGGTILHLLLAEIINNFDESKEEERTMVKLLCYFEKMLIESRQVSSDFKLVVCRKKMV